MSLEAPNAELVGEVEPLPEEALLSDTGEALLSDPGPLAAGAALLAGAEPSTSPEPLAERLRALVVACVAVVGTVLLVAVVGTVLLVAVWVAEEAVLDTASTALDTAPTASVRVEVGLLRVEVALLGARTVETRAGVSWPTTSRSAARAGAAKNVEMSRATAPASPQLPLTPREPPTNQDPGTPPRVIIAAE